MASDLQQSVTSEAAEAMAAAPADSRFAELRRTLKTAPVALAVAILAVIVFIAIFAPLLWTVDPVAINPIARLKRESAEFWLGTDGFGRDVYSRVMYGARISLIVGLGAAVISVSIGLFIGTLAGYFPTFDFIVMRVMDGLMAIPGILLAIALVTVSGASLKTVIVAISIPEIPRVVRLVRSVILAVRSEPFVEAAVTLGTPLPALLWRHMVPNTVAPLIVQGTFIFASAMLTEASMSFLGVGLPPEIPSWGSIMAEGRAYFQILPGLILYAGVMLALAVLSINILGDALRDSLDPRMAKKV